MQAPTCSCSKNEITRETSLRSKLVWGKKHNQDSLGEFRTCVFLKVMRINEVLGIYIRPPCLDCVRTRSEFGKREAVDLSTTVDGACGETAGSKKPRLSEWYGKGSDVTMTDGDVTTQDENKKQTTTTTQDRSNLLCPTDAELSRTLILRWTELSRENPVPFREHAKTQWWYSKLNHSPVADTNVVDIEFLRRILSFPCTGPGLIYIDSLVWGAEPVCLETNKKTGHVNDVDVHTTFQVRRVEGPSKLLGVRPPPTRSIQTTNRAIEPPSRHLSSFLKLERLHASNARRVFSSGGCAACYSA
jgi:hypothetical protein